MENLKMLTEEELMEVDGGDWKNAACVGAGTVLGGLAGAGLGPGGIAAGISAGNMIAGMTCSVK
ncbi:Blp family class II bacteriocin [Bacillus mycoides]|uniref:Blp family class II bacteriocin n=1 Tax=Bacillus mycoides TaxID=1405 RepID=UPI0036E723C4